MTQEDKDLLFKDICSRLPYGVIGAVPHYDEDGEEVLLQGKITGFNEGQIKFEYLPDCTDDIGAYNWFDIDLVKLYLRPLSSMTEEESTELSNIISEWFDKELFYLTEEPSLEYALSRINYSISPLLFDWLNKNMFDFRGLIPEGLAISTKEFNHYKDKDLDMKLEDLMVGDWVSYKDKMPCKITAICKDTAVVDNDTTQDWRIDYDKLTPIHITAEILEKNGFWSQHNVGYVMEEHENEIIYDLLDHKLRILKNREQILNLECFDDMCVHELQHALKLCGIKKNIEL